MSFSFVSAVVAKAPRKNVRSSVISPSGSASGKRKGKAGGGGNPLKLWPVPKGQKGLQCFFGGQSSEDGGCSSACVEAGSSSEQLEEFAQEQFVAEEPASCEEGSSHEEEGSSHEGEESDDTPIDSMNLLDDITQLNSDSED